MTPTCSVCNEAIRGDDTAVDGGGGRIHDDCAECECCGHTVGTCRIICDDADSKLEGK